MIVTVEPRLLSTQLPPILLVFCDRQNDIGLYDKIVLLFQFVDSCPDASLVLLFILHLLNYD